MKQDIKYLTRRKSYETHFFKTFEVKKKEEERAGIYEEKNKEKAEEIARIAEGKRKKEDEEEEAEFYW